MPYLNYCCPRVNKVCGCMNLRTGCMFIAIAQIVFGVIALAFYGTGRFWSLGSGISVTIGGGCLLYAAIKKDLNKVRCYLALTQIGIILFILTGGMIIMYNWNDWTFIGVDVYEAGVGVTKKLPGTVDMWTVAIILYHWACAPVLIYFWICAYNFSSRISD